MSCEKCDQSNRDRHVVWDGEPGEYHIEVGDYYYDVYGIRYCPWCGEDLSQRKEKSEDCKPTVQQEVQYDIMTLGEQGVWDKIVENLKPTEVPEYLKKGENGD